MKTQSITDFLEIFQGTYEEIKELTINRFNIIGDIAEVDLTDLLNFPNLEKLTLMNLIIDEKSIAILTKFNKLSQLNLINCEIITSYIPHELFHIHRLIVDNSNFEDYFNNVILDFLEIKNININCQKIKANTLKIDKTNIELENINFNNINHLIISEKQFNENKNFLFSNRINIKLTIKDNVFDEVIEEYEKI